MKKLFKKPTLKGVLHIAALLICGAVLGLNIYSANAGKLVGNQLPMPFGCGAAVVLSGSMEPELSVGDLILVRESDVYAVDDVVVFQEGSSLVVHRITDIADGRVTTKGDANNAADEPIELSAVKGRVVLSVPYVGTLVELIKTPVGTLCVAALAIALVEIPRRNEKKKDDEERQKIIDEINRLKEQV